MRTLAANLRDHFRRKRYQHIEGLFQVESQNWPILDLGGGPASFFASMHPQPDRIILIDIDQHDAKRAKDNIPKLKVVVADGGQLPLADRSIVLTICNSVIEHAEFPEYLASEIRRVSQAYFVQTPNGKFPLETHSYVAIPIYRFIPWIGLRRLACRLFGANFDYVNGVSYVREEKLRYLFPEASLTKEKWLAMTKSFYLYRLSRQDRS